MVCVIIEEHTRERRRAAPRASPNFAPIGVSNCEVQVSRHYPLKCSVERKFEDTTGARAV